MMKPDYRGARGSNAGDDFHELWTLRQAIMLLDENTNLRAVTVEGLRVEDESGTPKDTWDGVDCAFYFGGDSIKSAERVVIDQVKYSAANPEQTWTLARLIHSTNKKQDNSVIGRLAKAFAGLNSKRPDLAASGKLVVRLVSNQQVDPVVVSELSNHGTSHQAIRTTLRKASRLKVKDFEIFVSNLDFSECGSGSRFALDESVLATISEWIDDEASSAVNGLLRHVRQAMLPEGKGEYITRHLILSWLGYSDPRALFPCPSAIRNIEQYILRDVSHAVSEKMLDGVQYICLHGEGGCGKTAALQGIEDLLPDGSAMVIFDCYGGGRYLDADAYRHRDADAFVQLSNELASRLRIPYLLCQSRSHDFPRAFKNRLDKAAEVVASKGQEALLVAVIDAADNSVTAAAKQSPPDRSFVHGFVSMSQVPKNVRFVVTARTGQLPSLELPQHFTQMKMTGFTPEETAAHIRGIWDDAPATWIDDFHHLSNGNPRVQSYVLKHAGVEPVRALDYLRPSGKNLSQIFQEQFDFARKKLGSNQDIKIFCSGLIALPRPIPITDLSAVTGLTEANIHDLCADISPGVRLANGLIGFADEDFEHFVRTEAEDHLISIREKIADHFNNRRKSDAYAATYLASALFNANRRQEIIDLVNLQDELTIIGDPVLRRNVQLQRLRIAMKVCRETGSNVDAVLTLLRGAEALKTDDLIRRTLKENPDIAANFAHNTYSGTILRDPSEIGNHGPLLFQLMAVDARNGDSISVRESHRQVIAWLKRRAEYFEEQKKQHPNYTPQGWDITSLDIAAETEAILRTRGPQSVMDCILRWRPRNLALKVASILSYRLIISGEEYLVERCISEAGISAPWDLFLLIPLALAGKDVDLVRLKSNLEIILHRGLIQLDMLKDSWHDDNPTAEYLETILTACETVVARGGDRSGVIPVLERIADPGSRRRDKLFTSDAIRIDLSLRAYALLERLADRKMNLESYLIDPPEPEKGMSPKEVEQRKRASNEKKEELKSFIGPLLDLYDTRAQILLGLIKPGEIENSLREAINHFHSQDYRFNNQYRALAMRTRTALSLTRLMVIPSISRTVLMDCALAFLNSRSNTFRAGDVPVLASLALDHSLHKKILSVISNQVTTLKNMKVSADEKISTLISFARLLLPISPTDANSLANDAIDAAGEVNVEAIHEIALFKQLTEYAVSSMEVEERKRIACNLAVVVGDVAVRIADDSHFPWEDVARALTTLNVSVALAATARWEDSSLVDRTTFLPPLLETALSHGEMTPDQVAAFSPLLDHFNIELISQIVDKTVAQSTNPNQKILAEHLSREELLRFGGGSRNSVTDKLILLNKGNPGFWMEQLISTGTFLQAAIANQNSISNNRSSQTGTESEQTDPFSIIDWTAYHFTSAEEIHEVVDCMSMYTDNSKIYISVMDSLDRIGSNVALRDRVSHLEALNYCESPNVSGYALARAIAGRVTDWHKTPSIADWCRERLLEIIANHLLSFSIGINYGESPLPKLLEISGVPSERICTMLLEAMERHVDELDASTVYALVGLVSRYCTSDETSRIMSRYIDRLLERILIAERDKWDANDIPTETSEGISRFLYALMGDIDVRRRWQAAHSVRCLARFGDSNIVDNLVMFFYKTSEQSYRKPDAPFYWLSARLWLMISLNRIANETPSAIKNQGVRLLKIASNDDFPHVLVRAFAKSAICKLVDSGNLVLNTNQRKSLKRVNTSPLRRRKARPSYNVGFDKYREREDRRFHFDTMDTLSYWYTSKLNIFADVNGEEFLDIAEHWIVDRWGVQNNPWKWDDEPRKPRFTNRPFTSTYHSHGSMPTLERFHTYLEWHAMWCAIGDLMQTRALAKAAEDDYYTFECQLDRAGLTAPPLWLADLHDPKPIEHQLWFAPNGDVNIWVENVDNDEFLAELGLANDEGTIVVASSHVTESCKFRSSIRVNTALVSSKTAMSLTRALQTVQDNHDFRIPPDGDDLEINDPPYVLTGWLSDNEHGLRIDEQDPLRYDVNAIECSPSNKTITVLNLTFHNDFSARWIEQDSGKMFFIYGAWGDTRGDEREDTLRYDETVKSSGWRLKIDKEALKTFLNVKKCDLIVEIEITRRNSSYGNYRRYNEEEEKEARFDRIILMRKDGTIEAAEGCIGTWTVPSS
ncbi:hypothetical protein ACFLVO_02365 [Chloroflexota bacterium]